MYTPGTFYKKSAVYERIYVYFRIDYNYNRQLLLSGLTWISICIRPSLTSSYRAIGVNSNCPKMKEKTKFQKHNDRRNFNIFCQNMISQPRHEVMNLIILHKAGWRKWRNKKCLSDNFKCKSKKKWNLIF